MSVLCVFQKGDKCKGNVSPSYGDDLESSRFGGLMWLTELKVKKNKQKKEHTLEHFANANAVSENLHPFTPPPTSQCVRNNAKWRGDVGRCGERGGAEVDEGTEQTDMRRDKHMNNEAAKPPLAVRFSGPPPFSLPSFSPRYRHPPASPTPLPPASHLLYLRALFPLRLLPFFFFFYLVLFTAVVPPTRLLARRPHSAFGKEKKTKTNPQCFDKVFCPKCLNK